MAEHDELELLRQADPVDPAALPSATAPAAAALFERITMPDHDTNASTPTRRPTRLAYAAAAVAVIGLAVGAVAVLGDEDPQPDQAAVDTTVSTGPDATGGEPITPGAASCVEFYSLETLANRDAAFDGTVESVDGDTITFTVNTWYRGGEGDQTTRRGASTLGGMTSAGPSVNLDAGTRLLVAGDDDFAWACGFTQPYTTAAAADWARVLEG